jgi:DNA polymerase-1
MFPDYKKARKREKTEEEQTLDHMAYAQFATIRKEILPELGFHNNFKEEGYEADDIIAKIVQERCGPDEEIVIVSTDEDLYQLLYDNVSIYSIRKKRSYTSVNLWKDYRVTPKDWVDVKAIGGCSSDGIPGVSGVAEKTACKYIQRLLPVSTKAHREIRKNKELIERNRKLVELPLPGTPSFLIVEDSLKIRPFIDVSTKYGFMSFLDKDNLARWKEYVFHTCKE